LDDLEVGAVNPAVWIFDGLHSGIHVLFGGEESDEGHEGINYWTFGGFD